jgi:hypothetical protein
MTHSYVKAICQRIETIRELIKGKSNIAEWVTQA